MNQSHLKILILALQLLSMDVVSALNPSRDYIDNFLVDKAGYSKVIDTFLRNSK
jgi:hypothetical protein